MTRTFTPFRFFLKLLLALDIVAALVWGGFFGYVKGPVVLADLHPATDEEAVAVLRSRQAGLELEHDLSATRLSVDFGFTVFGASECDFCYSIAHFTSMPQYPAMLGFFLRGTPFIWLRAPDDIDPALQITPLKRAGIIAHEMQHALDYLHGLPSSEDRANVRRMCIIEDISPCEGL